MPDTQAFWNWLLRWQRVTKVCFLVPDDTLVFCMPPAGSLPTAANPGRVRAIECVKHVALPGEEHGIKIAVIAILQQVRRTPKYPHV